MRDLLEHLSVQNLRILRLEGAERNDNRMMVSDRPRDLPQKQVPGSLNAQKTDQALQERLDYRPPAAEAFEWPALKLPGPVRSSGASVPILHKHSRWTYDRGQVSSVSEEAAYSNEEHIADDAAER